MKTLDIAPEAVIMLCCILYRKDQKLSNLIDHANAQLKKAGLFDKDSDYNGMLGDATLALIVTFADQGHSGYSAMMTRELFHKLSNFEEL